MRLTRLLAAGLFVGCALAAGPAVAQQPCGTYSGRGCAPDASRVDLASPSFSNPTRIDNPLFPICTPSSSSAAKRAIRSAPRPHSCRAAAR
jgi:hypothetical protein